MLSACRCRSWERSSDRERSSSKTPSPPPGTPLSTDSVITQVARVAGGRFAPGHVGELTRVVPFEMVDAALVESRGQQQRVRDLPSRVVVYLVLAAGLFAELGYGQAWARMTAGLEGLEGLSVACGCRELGHLMRPARTRG